MLEFRQIFLKRRKLSMNLEDQISSVFDLQKKHKLIQKNTDATYRIQKLKLFKKNMIDHSIEIEQALQSDFKKADLETDLTEILPVISMINHYQKKLKSWMKPKKVRGGIAFIGTKKYISYEAKGNCLVISPWNYPFQLAVYPVLTAFAAGNTIILKPSEFTPATNRIIKKLFELTFEPREVTVIEGAVETSSLLLEKPFDHIFFTGSTPVGKIIMEKASKHLASVALELGGKSPVIIDPNYDLAKAAKNIVWGKLVNSGQTCVAPDYVMLEERQKEKFIKLCKDSIKEFYPTIENNSDYAAIINQKNFDRLKGLTQEAISSGAKLEVGGNFFENGKIEPTILTDLSDDMQIMQEEIFGPILPVLTKKSYKEMKKYINQNDNPLVTYVYSFDEGFIQNIRSGTHSGGFSINESLLHVASPTLPFGGAGKSGIGRYHGHYGFEEMSNIRAVLHRKFEAGTKFLYPPYKEGTKSIIKKIIDKFNRFL